jgi:hypothetical protein
VRLPGRKLSRAEHFRHAYRHHFQNHRRERQFISTGGFFATFAVTRTITHAIRAGKGPFHDIGGQGGTHIHHMTFGIVANLIVGYLWVMQVGTQAHPSPRVSRVTSFVYGAGAALTLDEFALWLNLEDDYWTDKGRESIDAVVLFGTLLSLGALGGGVLQKYARRLTEQRHSKESAKLLTALRDQQRYLRDLMMRN